jgi:hypothetical protein
MPFDRHHNRSRAKLAVVLSLATTIAAVAVTSAPAFAIPGKPITDTIYYIQSNNPSKAYDIGCAQGQKDAASDNRDSRVVIAFGTQTLGLDGNWLPSNDVYISNADVENVAEEVAFGYWQCTGAMDFFSTMYLEMSTNNSGPTPTTARGNAWGDIVTLVHNYVVTNWGQVIVQGANDIEPSWSSFSAAQAWVQGFAAHYNGMYLDTASSDGCPRWDHTNGTCNLAPDRTLWTQDEEWWISWGFAPALNAPQIYFVDQARQWYQISLWGDSAHNSPIYFSAVLDEWPDDHSTYTATDAWNTFLNMLWSTPSTSVTPPFSMEIIYES